MSEKDRRPKCFRVEPRTVVPGVDWQDGEKTVKVTKLYVVVESGTERYMGQNGTIFMSTSHMRPTEFFRTEDMADRAACVMHKTRGCKSPECGWTPKQVREEDELPF